MDGSSSRSVIEKWRHHLPLNPKVKLQELKERAERLAQKVSNKDGKAVPVKQ